MKLISYSLPLLSLTLVCVPLGAQSTFDVNVGLGTARVGSNGGGIDSINSSNAFGTCVPSSGDAECLATPKLHGLFLGLGGDAMLNKHFGVGAEVNLQPAKSDYGPLQLRQALYDFNGIYAPVNAKRVQLQLQGGIGGARSSFSYTQDYCVGTAVCTAQSQSVGAANHFQVHMGVGLQFFVTQHVFVRPQFDLHYVPNLNQQFGSNYVPRGTVWVGYSFGHGG